jgi:hypothetical protein
VVIQQKSLLERKYIVANEMRVSARNLFIITKRSN